MNPFTKDVQDPNKLCYFHMLPVLLYRKQENLMLLLPETCHLVTIRTTAKACARHLHACIHDPTEKTPQENLKTDVAKAILLYKNKVFII